MRFVYPHLLWLLLLLPLLAVLRGRRGAAPALLFSSTGILSSLARARRTRPARLRAGLRLFSMALLILAAARPQLGAATTRVKASGIDILLTIDVSGSMKAMDFTLDGKPASRLAVVKKVVADFISARPNDRIGLMIFAGRPYLVCPLTLDHDWLRQRLASLSVGMVDDGSTAIGTAIGSGVNRLRDRKAKSRIMILLTDGVNNAGRVPPLVAAQAAKAMGIKIYTIGAGTRGEASMPVIGPFGQRQIRMMRVDIDEDTLTKVAEKTGAQYFRATDTRSLNKIYHDINKMETTTRTLKKFEKYRELFPWLILAGLTLLVAELAIQGKELP